MFSACGEKIDPLNTGTGNIDDQVTYTEHIKPILDGNCTRCHAEDNQGLDRNGAPADVNLDTYDNAREASSRANPRIQAGTMPPGTGGIPEADRKLFRSWIDQGRIE